MQQEWVVCISVIVKPRQEKLSFAAFWVTDWVTKASCHSIEWVKADLVWTAEGEEENLGGK